MNLRTDVEKLEARIAGLEQQNQQLREFLKAAEADNESAAITILSLREALQKLKPTMCHGHECYEPGDGPRSTPIKKPHCPPHCEIEIIEQALSKSPADFRREWSKRSVLEKCIAALESGGYDQTAAAARKELEEK